MDGAVADERRERHHERRRHHAEHDRDRERDRGQGATPQRARLAHVVDPVEGGHHGADGERDVPEEERGREEDQEGGPGREDLLHRVVDAAEDRGRHVRLDRGPDALVPGVVEAERAEESEAEQDQRD